MRCISGCNGATVWIFAGSIFVPTLFFIFQIELFMEPLWRDLTKIPVRRTSYKFGCVRTKTNDARLRQIPDVC
jgi:hypothetical protein